MRFTPFAGTVGVCVERAKASPSERTTWSCRPSHAVTDGQTIVVRYGRKLTVTIDGPGQGVLDHGHHRRPGPSELGLRAEDARLSASRSAVLIGPASRCR